MTQLTWGLVVAAFAALLFLLMWTAWRRRTRRDAQVETSAAPFAGPPTTSFPRVFYVATTPAGAPLERVAAPGLAFRGYGELDLFTDGLEFRLPGEHPVRIPGAQILGSGTAQTRIDKVVEADGLALVRWQADDRELESSFRFPDPAGQRAFADAVEAIARATPYSSLSDDTTQEA